VISGDHPSTVAAIAGAAGVPMAEPGMAIDAGELPTEPAALANAVEDLAVIGRITPEQKRSVVRALQSLGHVVAMTGDGVNDVLALKQADLGIAMGSGTDATRAVASVVLLENDFAALPGVVAEGRRVIVNIERVANLFVTKTVYALLLALVVVSARLPYPFFPRHLTVVNALAIGIPAFFLALAPNSRPARSGFLRRVALVSLPFGAAAAVATLAAYVIARHQAGASAQEARTAAMLSLLGVSLWILVVLARPMTALRGLLVLAMVGGCALIFAWPWAERFLALSTPTGSLLLWTMAMAAGGAAMVEAAWRVLGTRVLAPAGLIT